MATSSTLRLLRAFAGGLFLLLVVIGSFGMAALDPDLHHQTSLTHRWTPTLFPTVASTPPVTAQPTPTLPPALIRHCTPPPGWHPYRVRSGETLLEIAWRVGLSPYLLARINCLGTLEVQAGETLYLPGGAAQPAATPTYQCGPPPGWRIIYVQPKETLYTLAVRYGTTV